MSSAPPVRKEAAMGIESEIKKEVAKQVKELIRKQTTPDLFDKRGAKWEQDEEDALIKIWRSFVYRAAYNHRRTPKAIIARLELMHKHGQLCI
jgi:hypothetical protein